MALLHIWLQLSVMQKHAQLNVKGATKSIITLVVVIRTSSGDPDLLVMPRTHWHLIVC